MSSGDLIIFVKQRRVARSRGLRHICRYERIGFGLGFLGILGHRIIIVIVSCIVLLESCKGGRFPVKFFPFALM